MEQMEKILQLIQKHGVCVYSVTEVEEGRSRTVNLRDCSLGDLPVCRNIYSVAKAFTMAAVGLLYDEKKLRMEDTIGEVLGPLPAGCDPKWAEVTVDDLLRHKTGYDKSLDSIKAYDLDCHDLRRFTDGDWLPFILSRPITGRHGEEGSYTDTGYYVLSRMVARRAGMPMQDYLRERLFNPLGFRDWAWYACPMGHAYGGTGLVMSSTDMAKLGQLWLQLGQWEGRRILSEEWVHLALERHYVFSRLREGRELFCKGGMYNQRLIFSYDENRVLSILSYTHDIDLVLEELYPEKKESEERT